MGISPLNIKAAEKEETFSVGEDVMFTIVDIQANQACISILAPVEMKVATSPARKIFQANDGTRMSALRIGESLSIGGDISVLLLTANDGKVRFGLNSGSNRVRKCESTPLRSRTNHGFF